MSDEATGVGGSVSAALGKAVDLMLSIVTPETTEEFLQKLKADVQKGKAGKAKEKLLEKAREFIEEAQFISAAEILREGANLLPNDEAILVALADAYLRTGDHWRHARPALSTLRAGGSMHEITRLEPCLEGEPHAKAPILSAFVQKNADCRYPFVYKALAFTHLATAPDRAKELLQRVVLLDPDDEWAHDCLARTHRVLGEENSALIEEDILKVIKGTSG